MSEAAATACEACGAAAVASAPWCGACGALLPTRPPPVAGLAPGDDMALDPELPAGALTFDADDDAGEGPRAFALDAAADDGDLPIDAWVLDAAEAVPPSPGDDADTAPLNAPAAGDERSAADLQTTVGAIADAGHDPGDDDELSVDLPEITDLDIVIDPGLAAVPAVAAAPIAPTALRRPTRPTPAATAALVDAPYAASAVATVAAVAPPAAAPVPLSFFPSGQEPIAADVGAAPLPSLEGIALELPAARPRRASRQDMAARLQEFSVMFRIDDRARGRRRLALRALIGLALVAGAVAASRWLAARDPGPSVPAAELLAGVVPPHVAAGDYLLVDRSVQPPRSTRVKISALAARLADAAAMRALRGGR